MCHVQIWTFTNKKETIVVAKESKLASHNEQNKNKKAKNKLKEQINLNTLGQWKGSIFFYF
jgi:hypothetical protein